MVKLEILVTIIWLHTLLLSVFDVFIRTPSLFEGRFRTLNNLNEK